METEDHTDSRPKGGRVVLSCGCEYAPAMGELSSLHVRYRTEACDPVEGFVPAVNYAVFCPKCRDVIANDLISSDEEEQDWLSSG